MVVLITSPMRIVHMESVMFSQFTSFLLFTGGGVSGKVHYEPILATRVLMPMGGGSGKVH